MDSPAPLARIHLTQTPYQDQGWGGTGNVALFREAYLQGREKKFTLTDDPIEADYIIFCEAYQQAECTFAPALRNAELVQRFPEKVFVITAEDQPLPFLSGLYCSLPRSRFDPQRHRTCAYFGQINPHIVAWENRREEITPRQLFSFVGAPTAEVRREIFRHLGQHPLGRVRETGNLQYNVKVDDPAKAAGQNDYLQIILDSHFVLCPRGAGTSSFRLFETMRLGRAPVILADDWVPPVGPDWDRCSLRIAENRLAELPDLLRRHESAAASMGRLARSEWEKHFAPDVFVARCFENIHALALARSGREADHFARWPQMIANYQRSQRGGASPLRWLLRRAKARLYRTLGR